MILTHVSLLEITFHFSALIVSTEETHHRLGRCTTLGSNVCLRCVVQAGPESLGLVGVSAVTLFAKGSAKAQFAWLVCPGPVTGSAWRSVWSDRLPSR